MNGEEILEKIDVAGEGEPLLKNKKKNSSDQQLTINLGEPYYDLNNDNNKFENFYQKIRIVIWLISRGRGYRIIKSIIDNRNYRKNPSLNQAKLNNIAMDNEQHLPLHDEIHFGIYPYIDSFFNGVYFVTNKIWPIILIPLLISKHLPVGVGIIPIITAPVIWGLGNFLKHYSYNKLYNLQKLEKLRVFLSNEPKLSLASTFDPLWCALHNAKYAILCDQSLPENIKIELFKQIISMAESNALYKTFVFDIIADICDFSTQISNDTNKINFLLKNAENDSTKNRIDYINKYYAKFKLSSLGLNLRKSENFIFLICAVPFFVWDTFAKILFLDKFIRAIKNHFSYPAPTPIPTPTTTPIPTANSTSTPTPTQITIPPITTINPPTNSSTPTPTPTPATTPPITTTNPPTNSSTPTPSPTTTSPGTACIDAGKEWLYMPEYSEMICSMCGDLPVYINDINNVQGCVSGLLAQPQTPEYILSSLSKLSRFANDSNLCKLDLSQQHGWSNWNTTIFGKILNIISNLTSYLDVFDGSQPDPNTNFIDNGNLQKLAEFSHSVTINQINFKNLGAGKALAQSFLNNSNVHQATHFDFTGNNITDSEYVIICEKLPPSLTTFKVQNNNITDIGFAQSAPNIANSAIKYLDISNNPISQGISNSLPAIIKKGVLQFLKFVGNDLTGVDLTAFWQATTQNSSLISVDLSQTNLVDNQLASIAPYANQTTIRDFIMRNNKIGDFSVSLFMSVFRNTQIRKIDFSFSLLGSNGLNNLAQNLPYTNITSVILDGIQIASSNLQQLVKGLIESIVDHLSLQFNYLDDMAVNILKDWLTTPNKTINVLDLSNNNQITDVGGVDLANTTAHSTVAEIKLNNNNLLTSVTGIAFSNNLPLNNLKVLKANGCNFGPDAAIAIGNVLDQSELEIIDLGNNPLLNGTRFLAQKLITATPDPNNLANETLSTEEANALIASKPASKVRKIILPNTGADIETVRTICRTIPQANISDNDFDLMDNPFDHEDINPKNCRFNQTNDSINLALRNERGNSTPSYSYLPSSVAQNNGNGMQSAVLGLSSVIIIVPAIILTMIALYWIYKTLSPSAIKLSAKTFGVFSKSEKEQKSLKVFVDKHDQSNDKNEPKIKQYGIN